MIKVAAEGDRVLVAKIHEVDQDQVFTFWDRLTPAEQGSLLAQIHRIDLPRLKKLAQEYLHGSQEVLEARVLAPAPVLRLGRAGEDQERRRRAREAGEEALRRGQVALLTAAGETGPGGAGEIPRGVLAIGPVSGKSLLRLHAEKVRAIARRYRAAPPWIVATSPGSRDAIVRHFEEEGHFGLNRSDVTFLIQDELPVLNRRGKILLAEPGRLAVSPGGHGGVLAKLLESDEILRSLEVRRIEHLFYFQVDNPMVNIADPEFLGLHLESGGELSSKSVRKTDPQERVGIFCQFNGAVGVVEHRELSEADRERREPEGGLSFSAANIGIHLFSLEFLRRLRAEGFEFPHHVVEKSTPHLDRKGKKVAPRSPAAIHFECFIFDALRRARSALILETARDEEFSPVKNASGANSPSTARSDLSRMYARWLRAAGAKLSSADGPDPVPIEISPLFALDAEELSEKLVRPLEVGAGFYLE